MNALTTSQLAYWWMISKKDQILVVNKETRKALKQ